MATTYKEGQVIEHDGVVLPALVPEAPVTVAPVAVTVTVEDATGRSEPEPLAVPEQVLVTPVKPVKAKAVPKVKAPLKVKLGKHKQ